VRGVAEKSRVRSESNTGDHESCADSEVAVRSFIAEAVIVLVIFLGRNKVSFRISAKLGLV